MKNIFFKNKTSKSNFMTSKRKLFKSFLFTSALLGASVILQKPSQAQTMVSPVCPDPSSTTITSIDTQGDTTSFYNLTKDSNGNGGFCRGTPETYGVTVYKMGFCTVDPGDPEGASGDVRSGLLPDYSSCTWTYENASGEEALFSSGGEVELNSSFSSSPAIGNYPHAVMIISKDFKIKGSYGPIGPINGTRNTYYSTTTFDQSSTQSSDYAITTAPLQSFYDSCTAHTEENIVDGGTIDAYLLDSEGRIIASNSGISECTGQVKLLGVMNMSNNVQITSGTKGLTMTFKVADNGMSVGCDDNCTEIIFDSGPFSVVFETF